MDTGKAALGGLDGNLAAALGYPIGIIALISVFMEKDNKFVKFHALQSVFLIVAWIVVVIALMIVSVVLGLIAGGAAATDSTGGGIVGILVTLIWVVMWLIIPLAFFIALIFAAVKAYGGSWFKLPVIGNMAENMANK
jgi:uncharacterized membrane protein